MMVLILSNASLANFYWLVEDMILFNLTLSVGDEFWVHFSLRLHKSIDDEYISQHISYNRHGYLKGKS
jgi:hypothetical protein